LGDVSHQIKERNLDEGTNEPVEPKAEIVNNKATHEFLPTGIPVSDRKMHEQQTTHGLD
jgi:hypothetical protein